MSNINIKYLNRFSGYSNFSDPTNCDSSKLIAGSLNTIINNGEKLSPRAGMDYFGATGADGTQTDVYWTLAHRIHSKYDDFVNKQGVKIPIRVFYDGTLAKADVMEVYLPIYASGVVTTTKKWYQVTATAPTLPIISTHRWYFAEWYDGALLPPPGVLQPELIFTYGATKIGNWSGGFANVTVVTATTIKTNTTWLEKGFIWSVEGANIITVNGVQYTVTGGFTTDTLTVASTAGINVDDVAFQNPYFDDDLSGKTTYDVCSTINNQVYYEDWKQRNVYISWNRNQIQELNQPIYTGSSGLDDATFTGPYTATDSLTRYYQVKIDSVTPAIDINEQTFYSPTGGANDATINTSAFTQPVDNLKHIYRVVIVSNYVLTPKVGTHLDFFSDGELIIGQTSNANGYFLPGTNDFAGGAAYTNVTSGIFLMNEIVEGETTPGFFNPKPLVTLYAVTRGNTFRLYKDNVFVDLAPGQYSIACFGTIALIDGLTITFPDYGSHETGDYLELVIQKVPAHVDTFSWSLNGDTQASNVHITGAAQNLSLGVKVTFANTTGHDKGDTWDVKAIPTIIRGWHNFTYDPVNNVTGLGRAPGQGFKITLDSNGWAMRPQEKYMLINAQAGHYYDVVPRLSADLQNESIAIERLKSEPQNKVLYPYLLTYMKNQLAIMSQEKTFDLLGRQKFLELQQTKTISDEVRIDFETSNWEDADILYYKRKIYFNLPKEGLIFIYDDYKKFWQPPQQFGMRISLLSIIDDKLIGHSYERNESYELFTGLNDVSIYPIKTRIVLPYDSAGNRMISKAMQAIGFEGYIEGNPDIKYTINAEVGGCYKQKKGSILPLNTMRAVCVPFDRASLGKSSLGFHGLGNDPITPIPHFFYIRTFDNIEFYQRNIEIECDSLDQNWSLIALGTDINKSNTNNVEITDPN